MSLSARPHPITTYGKTTTIYVLVTFCTDKLAPSVGKTLYVHTFGHQMAHFSVISTMAGSSDTTCFDLLEFLRAPAVDIPAADGGEV